jgi:hypothetical protein
LNTEAVEHTAFEAVIRLAHRAYTTLLEDHIGRQARKAFECGVEDADIKIQLLLGGAKMAKEALGEALEQQAVLVAARPQKNNTKIYRGYRSPPTRRRDTKQSGCCGEPGHFESNCPYGRKADNERRRKLEDKPSRDKLESPRRSEWRPSHNEDTNRSGAQLPGRRRRADASHHALTVITENADSSLVTQGWVGDKPCLVTGACVTVARPDIAVGWPEREPNQRFTLQTVSGEALAILKEVFLTLTLGRSSLKIWVFVADITNGFILGLDILPTYDASVFIGRRVQGRNSFLLA